MDLDFNFIFHMKAPSVVVFPEYYNLLSQLCLLNHKVGVLYVTKGQQRERDAYSNDPDVLKPEFFHFMDSISKKVTLQGFLGYSGGLDTTSNSARLYACLKAVYCRWGKQPCVILFKIYDA